MWAPAIYSNTQKNNQYYHTLVLPIDFFLWEWESVCFLTLVSSLLEGDYTLCARRLNAINQSNTIILNLGHFFLKKRKNSVCVCALYTERRESEKRKNWHFSILPQKDLEKKNTHGFYFSKEKGEIKKENSDKLLSYQHTLLLFHCGWTLIWHIAHNENWFWKSLKIFSINFNP